MLTSETSLSDVLIIFVWSKVKDCGLIGVSKVVRKISSTFR